jgi:Zn-dependent M28 family amino/carboxypeptidase
MRALGLARRLAAVSGLIAAALMASPAGAAEPVFSPARVSADIRTLSSDAFEGRGPATPAEDKTVAWLIAQFRAAGLQPGGTLVKGVRGWTQDVPLQHADFLAPPHLTVSGLGAWTQGREVAIRAPQNGGQTYDLAAAPLVFVGYGVSAPERQWDDFKGVDLHGKVAVVLVNDPDFEDAACANDCLFGGKAMTYYGRWTYKYEEMARRGAAGVLVIHEDKPASYGWATVVSSNTSGTFDIVRKDPSASHTPLEGWMARDAAVALFKASGLDFEAAKAKARQRDFTPVTLTPTLDISYRAKVEVIHSKNVVGLLPGRNHPGETVLYSAHWDHLGIGVPDAKGDRIYNGALDNASGTAALVELARAWGKAPRAARSAVFLAVTAEERGLLGSEYYAQNPLYPLGTTVGAINMDGPFGIAGGAHDFTISGSAKLGLLDLLVAQGQRQGLVYTPEAHPEAGGFYRSDHFSFAKVGVPAVSFELGQDLIKGGKARGEAVYKNYVEHHYHQPSDEWREDWDLSGVPQALGMVYTVGRQLADGRDWPRWGAGSEFSAERDKTMALRK